jgi:hypothetical protein
LKNSLRLFFVLRSVAALASIASLGASLRAQSFTFAQLKSLARENPGMSSRDFGGFATRVPQGFLQSEAFQAIKAKAALGSLTEFPPALQPAATSPGRDAPRAVTVNLAQVGTPTAVPELPEYAAFMGLATLAYVVARRRGASATPGVAS